MSKSRPERRIVNIHEAEYGLYNMEGPEQPEIGWLALSYNADGNGCYAMRMAPGSKTFWHEHGGMEDFLVLEGELIESDGTVLKAGDVVSYQPGSAHSSRTDKGCLIIGFDWGNPAKP